MTKIYCSIVIVLAFLQTAHAQNCILSTTCNFAQLVCGYDMENEIFDNNVPHVQDFNTNCLIDPHNSVWFEVIACSDSLSLIVNTYTSLTGDGLQVALFDECYPGVTSIACNGGIAGGAGIPLTLFAHVTPGQIYWLVVDGFGADVCTFNFEILSGISTNPPPGNTGPFDGQISGPTSGICGLGGGNYTAEWPECANWHGSFGCASDSCSCVHWTIPPGAQIIGNSCSKSVYIDFSGTPPGTYVIKASPECLCDANACPVCQPVCCPVKPLSLVITISGPAIVDLPDSLICFGNDFPDCVFEPGNIYAGNTGICYTHDLASCTTFRKHYKMLNQMFSSMGQVSFCDSFELCGVTYTTPGFYQAQCVSSMGCDSLVLFSLIRDPACRFMCPDFNQPAPPGETCSNSPFFCGNHLGHYCSSNSGFAGDTIGSSIYPAAGFIRFSPCSDSIDLRIGVQNCTSAQDTLAFSVYAGQCLPDSILKTTQVAQFEFRHLLLNGLMPDSTYTLLVSGVHGSECSFTVEAISGIGTASLTPAQCVCTDGHVAGPDVICPGDIYTYSVTFPACTVTPGVPVGGNQQFCLPPEACPAPDDSLVMHWHIPPGTHFVSDSTGLTIDIQLDSSYFNLDTLRSDSVWLDWTVIHLTQPDSLIFCDCQAAGCFGGRILPQYVTIKHEIHHDLCFLNCENPVCTFGGQSFMVPGSYILQQDNCSISTLQVVADFVPPPVPAVPAPTICLGETAVLTVVNIPSWYIVSWSDGGSSNPHPVTPLSTKSYTVTVTNPANGCISTAITQVTVNPVPITVIPAVHLCPGENITICGEQLSGAGQHQAFCTSWLGCDSIIQVNIIEDTVMVIQHGVVATLNCGNPCQTYLGQQYCSPGDYVRTIGCEEHHFTIAIDNQAPNLTAVADPGTICAGSTTTLIATTTDSGIELSWTDLTNGIHYTSDTVMVSPNDTTLYAATAFNPQNGCTEVQMLHVYVHPPDVTDLGQVGQVTCNSPCFLFNGITYCIPGEYRDTANCLITKFSIGFAKETMEHGLIGTLTCQDSCIIFMGQSWCSAGDYTLEDSCFLHHFEINADQATPELSVSADLTSLCIGQSATLTATSDNSSGIFTWINTNSGDTYPGPVVQVSPGDTTMYRAKVINPQNHCSSQMDLLIAVHPFEVVNLGLLGFVSCDSPCIAISGTTYCLPGNYADTVNCVISNFTIGFEKSVVEDGLIGTLNCHDTCLTYLGHSYCAVGDYTLEDSCYIHHFQVDGNFSAPVCSTPQHNCLSNNAQFTVGFSISGSPPYKVNNEPFSGSYFLSGPLPNGTHYQYIIKQLNGCSTMVTGTYDCSHMCISDPGALSPGVLQGCAGVESLAAQNVASPEVAPGDIVEYRLQNANGLVLLWNNSGIFSFDSSLMQVNVNYQIIRVVGPADSTGRPDMESPCTDSTSAQPLIFRSIPHLAEVTVDRPKCPGQDNGVIEVKKVNDGNPPYLFSINGGVLSSLSKYENLSAGAYHIMVQDAFGCLSDQSYEMPDGQATIAVDIGADREINLGQTVTLHAELSKPAASLVWMSDDGLSQSDTSNWTISPKQTVQVLCEVTDENGCTSRDEIMILVKTETGIYQPNVLMPEGNSIENQYFTIYSAPGWVGRIKSLFLYDRWGELVWEKHDFPSNVPNEGWNGMFHGKSAPPGVYVYRVELELANGDTQVLNGDVTLIR